MTPPSGSPWPFPLLSGDNSPATLAAVSTEQRNERKTPNTAPGTSSALSAFPLPSFRPSIGSTREMQFVVTLRTWGSACVSWRLGYSARSVPPSDFPPSCVCVLMRRPRSRLFYDRKRT